MNIKLLKSVMVKNDDTQESLAKALGLSSSRLNAKVNETDGASFTVPEMQAIIDRYHLTADESQEIFFPEKLS